MDWSKGYEATYYMTIVDRATWRDVARIDIKGGSISRVSSGLLNSASVECSSFEYGETWIRVYLDAKQGETAEHIPLITGLTSTPTHEYDGQYEQQNVQIYSVLKPLEDVLLPRGWYAGAGSEGVNVISSLLDICPAPVSITGESPRLSEAIIAEEDETRLSMLEKILLAMDWRIRLHGDGTIEMSEKAMSPMMNFDGNTSDYLEPEVSIERDWFTLPNVFRATSGDNSGIAIDDDPDSPLSTVSRGREIWMSEQASNINEGETLAEYARRRLREEQQSATTASYSRRFHPDIVPSDMIYLRYPNIQGKYLVESQSIALSYAGRTSEEVIAWTKR